MSSSASFVYDLDMEFPAQIGVRVLTVEYRRGLRWHYDRLAAPYWRFYWNRTPGALVRLEDRTVRIEPETAYLVAPDTGFSVRCEAPIDHFYVHFTLDLPLHKVRSGVHRLPDSAALSPLVEQLLGQVDATEPRVAPALAGGLALAAFGQLRPEAVEVAASDPLVRRAETAIESGLPAAVDLHGIAEALGASERTLRRRFRAVTGETPRAYAERRRVEQACILLHFSDRTIDEIADETGFCDRYHFSRVFAQHRGMGPAVFRRVVEEVPVRAH
jgi:AraC-like DNA-binding protein